MQTNFQLGFIGFGSMGGMLAEGFLRAGAIAPASVWVATRSPNKLTGLSERYPTANIATNGEVAQQADVLFLCVNPKDIYPVLTEIAGDLKPGCNLVSIAACVQLADMARIYSGPISRVIPSLTAEVASGLSLVCHNPLVSTSQQARLETLLASISQPKLLPETDFEIGSILTSCAPGLIASIFEQFALAAARVGGIPQADATEMVIKTLEGTARLFMDKNLDFRQTIQRVATQGGTTELGVQVLSQGLPPVFDELLAKTQDRYKDRKAFIKSQFDS